MNELEFLQDLKEKINTGFSKNDLKTLLNQRMNLVKNSVVLADVIVNEVEFCTCGNPSGEGNIQMVNDEELLYFCCDCNKQVQN